MGSQVNFFLTPGDTARLEAVVRLVQPFVVLHSRSPTPSPRQLANVDFVEGGEQWLFFHLVRPEDVGAVVMRHVPAQGYWTVDVLRSPVIEFNGCFFDSRTLRRGRVYYTPSFFDADGALVQKPQEFLAWSKSLFAAVKKNLKRRGTEYVGTEAEAWTASGGEFKT